MSFSCIYNAALKAIWPVISNFSESTQTERRHGTVKSESILKTHANKKNQLLQGNGSTEGTFFSRQLLFLAKGSDVAVNP